MKKLLLIVLSLCPPLWTYAQLKDSLTLSAVQMQPALEARFREKLVELARQNPNSDAIKAREQINRLETQNARAAWLNHFSASANANEYSLKQNSNTQNIYYPRYNFSVGINLGNLITIPNNVKISKTNRKLIAAQKANEDRDAKVTVLKMYETYTANKKVLELQLPLLEDALNYYKQMERKFSGGEISIDQYSASYRIYNSEMVRNVQLIKELNQSRIELEGMIGMTLESALHLITQP